MSHPTSLVLANEDHDLRTRFLALQSRSDLASLLDVREKDIIYYSVRLKARYRVFRVNKRSDPTKTRELKEPVNGLKIVQQKLLQALTTVYAPPMCVHGFVSGRSIATNAAVHEGQQEILNIDLQDFFSTIHFGRVWGMLQAPPYRLPRTVATIIAQLTTEKNVLPQGAPTSPILANMVAQPLDRALITLARRRRLRVTRYADDITVSSGRTIPKDWVAESGSNARGITVSGELRKTIEKHGFKINDSKVSLKRRPARMEVTGLIVNRQGQVPSFV